LATYLATEIVAYTKVRNISDKGLLQAYTGNMEIHFLIAHVSVNVTNYIQIYKKYQVILNPHSAWGFFLVKIR